MKICQACHNNPVIIRRPKDHSVICKSCFFESFESDVHRTILTERMFQRNDRVLVAVSGGKDSTVLAHVLVKLNQKYKYGVKLILVSIDEGIKGYRDASIRTVMINQKELNSLNKTNFNDLGSFKHFDDSNDQNNLENEKNSNDEKNLIHKNDSHNMIPLHIFSYQDLYGHTMNSLMKYPLSACTYCGVLRRNALDHAAEVLKVDKIVTGHNLEDMAETLLLNLVRGDFYRLTRSNSQTSNRNENAPERVRTIQEIDQVKNQFKVKNEQKETNSCKNERISHNQFDKKHHFKYSSTDIEDLTHINKTVTRIKPFKYIHQKEIIFYAHLNELLFFSIECPYATGSHREYVREFISRLDSRKIETMVLGGKYFEKNKEMTGHHKKTCNKCGRSSNNPTCKKCLLLDHLNKLFIK